jgi:hypothetical protein
LAPLPSLGLPPEAQRANRRVMPGTWRDPDDVSPSAARTARMVKGWLSYCPLRRMQQRFGVVSGITAEHIAAADHLRRLYDAATLGFTGIKDMTR